MDTTTPYGTWYNHTGSLSVENSVIDAVGDFGHQYDIDAIAEEYRQAVNDALPDGFYLSGDDFYAPFYDADRHLDGHPTDILGNLDIGTIVEGIDLEAIMERHQVPEITRKHLEALEHSRTFAVLWINPEDDGRPMALNLWDCQDPTPGPVAVRHSDLTEAWDSVAEKWDIDPAADVLDFLRPLVVKAARAARTVKTEA